MKANTNPEGVITNAEDLTVNEVAHQAVLCPGCGTCTFKMWPEGWDAHAAHRCTGLIVTGTTERKKEFKTKFLHLFRNQK